MLKQEAITYKQKAVLILSKEQFESFNDQNLVYTVKFLSKSPMSISDLVQAFKKLDMEKSEKSIYRYLNKLLKLKLVAKAGKRITSIDESDLISETIYLRSAKVFLTKACKECPEGVACPEYIVALSLLKNLFKGKELSAIKLAKLGNKLNAERNKVFIDLISNADSETLEEFTVLDMKKINFVKEFVSWLAISLNIDIPDEINQCCQ